MSPIVIDLTGSPEPAESPTAIAKATPQGSQPRAQRPIVSAPRFTASESEEHRQSSGHDGFPKPAIPPPESRKGQWETGFDASNAPRNRAGAKKAGDPGTDPQQTRQYGRPEGKHGVDEVTKAQSLARHRMKPYMVTTANAHNVTSETVSNGSLASLLRQQQGLLRSDFGDPTKLSLHNANHTNLQHASPNSAKYQERAPQIPETGSLTTQKPLNNDAAVQPSSAFTASFGNQAPNQQRATHQTPSTVNHTTPKNVVWINLVDSDDEKEDPAPSLTTAHIEQPGDTKSQDPLDTRPAKRQRIDEGEEPPIRVKFSSHTSPLNFDVQSHSDQFSATALESPLVFASQSNHSKSQSVTMDPKNVGRGQVLQSPLKDSLGQLLPSNVEPENLVNGHSAFEGPFGDTYHRSASDHTKSAVPSVTSSESVDNRRGPKHRAESQEVAQLAAVKQNKASSLANPQHETPNTASDSLDLDTVSVSNTNALSSHGTHYTLAEDSLLVQLKEVDGLNWDEITARFGTRSKTSLQTRYSYKRSNKSQQMTPRPAESLRSRTRANLRSEKATVSRSTSTDSQVRVRSRRQKRNAGDSVINGFVSWAEAGDISDERDSETSVDKICMKSPTRTILQQGRSHPKALACILRQREIGSSFGRSWVPSARGISDEMKEHVFDDIGPRAYYKGMSGDVTCLAWASDARRFAAGSVAITDDRSMQYNRPYNLLLGDNDRRVLKDLPEHHIARPIIDADSGNVNALHSMRESQDPRLFATVGSLQFSVDGSTLYTAGSDQKVRAYGADNDVDNAFCLYEIEHSAPVTLLTVSKTNLLATACEQSADGSIGVYKSRKKVLSLSPSRLGPQTDHPIYPSTLKWGMAPQHSSYLLGGFAADHTDGERDSGGETCLWDIRSESRVEIESANNFVFDVAWNPTPSSASTIFAVACTPGNNKVSKGTRSVVQCFAPKQNRAARVLEWECPAMDINDLIYCPHDDHLIAVGATDGKVHVWDKRFVKRLSSPLHVFSHGDTLNVLDHDRDLEIADTGINFLSWGATASRLYSGSSDGVVKAWDPHRASDNAHIRDVATFTSAVMSGSFSPDYRDLLIGEEQGRVNILRVGYRGSAVRSMQCFELQSAPAPVSRQEHQFAAAREMLETAEIELRPMGALPVRQAVQGPNYRGPYLKPLDGDIAKAETNYRIALNCQKRARSQATVSTSQRNSVDEVRYEADERVQDALSTLLQLQSRLDDYNRLMPKAEDTQRAFRRSEKEHSELKVSLSVPMKNCTLACNYLPTGGDSDEAVPDSHRSEARIPNVMRSRAQPLTDHLTLTPDDLLDAGLTGKCRTCLGPAPKSAKPHTALCEQCYRKQNGLTAICSKCSAPFRPLQDIPPHIGNRHLCDKCNFACFRCGASARVSQDCSSVHCTACGLTWAAGALGYELVERLGPPKQVSGLSHRTVKCNEEMLDDGVNDVQLGSQEIEYYASKWQTRVVA